MSRSGGPRRGRSVGDASDEETAGTTAAGGPVRRTVVIANSRGLHARAAARFVKVAGSFKADITVTRNDVTVSGLSIMGLMMLAAGLGAEIEIVARGADAVAAVAALERLVEERFGEE